MDSLIRQHFQFALAHYWNYRNVTDTSYPVFFNYHLQQYPQYPPLTPPTPITLPTNQFSDCMGEMVESGCQRVSRQCSMDLRNVVQPVECNGGYQPRTPQPMDVYSPMVNLQSGKFLHYIILKVIQRCGHSVSTSLSAF